MTVAHNSLDDEAPSSAEMRKWMSALCDPNQVIALWIKNGSFDGTKKHAGGYYKASRLSTVIEDAKSQSGLAVGVHWAINPVRPDLLNDADHELVAGIGVPKDADVLRRRYLPIDIDPKRKSEVSATADEKERARQVMLKVGRFLDEREWPRPAIVDSGNGFYLLYRIDLPSDDGGLVKRVLKSLQGRFADQNVDIDTTVANAGRVLKIPGTMACKGPSTSVRPHRYSRLLKLPKNGLEVVRLALLESLVEEENRVSKPRAIESLPRTTNGDIERARRYILKLPAAISGQHGHSALLLAATRIVVGFDFPARSSEALLLIAEFNERCDPPWSESDLQRKLEEADRLASERGDERGSLRYIEQAEPATEFERLPGRPFPFEVPDYVLAPSDLVLGGSRVGESNGTPAMGIGTVLVMKALRSDVGIPDALVRDIYWGSEAPKAWRRTLRKLHEDYALEVKCYDDCAYQGTGIRHHHLIRPAQAFNECLEDFADPKFPKTRGQPILHRSYVGLSAKTLDDLRRKGQLYYAYCPALVFGRSRALGLTPEQTRLLLGITGELTRVGTATDGKTTASGRKEFHRATSVRIDRAEVINGQQVAASARGSHRILCPHLDESRQYVVFGGNFPNRRGRGYSLIRVKKLSWQQIAGFGGEKFEADPDRRLRLFLDDLHALSQIFDLMPVGRHHRRQEWKSLPEMKECLRSGVGHDWLHEATLRIFAPADYLTRWRYVIAKRLGFSWIPGADCPFPLVDEAAEKFAIQNGAQLRNWLDLRNWSEARLATALGVARETVSRHVSGLRNSESFWDKMNQLLKRLSKNAQ